MATVFYKRATFVTHLPEGHRYTLSHNWIASSGKNQWRVGYTKFALRMLGEIVDVQVEKRAGDLLQPGEVIGTIEGFKALSDMYCVGTGAFLRGNPVLSGDLEGLSKNPYDEGWLYEFEGQIDARAMDVNGYRNLLDVTIDRMLQKETESKTR